MNIKAMRNMFSRLYIWRRYLYGRSSRRKTLIYYRVGRLRTRGVFNAQVNGIALIAGNSSQTLTHISHLIILKIKKENTLDIFATNVVIIKALMTVHKGSMYI